MWARDVVLDGKRALSGTLVERSWWAGPRLVMVFAPFVGLVTGSFSVDEPVRAVLMFYAAVKMPLLILGTALLCLPGFFVLHLAFGARRDFPITARGVLGGQAVFAIVLASMAPLLGVWYTAIDTKRSALIGAGLLFGIASAVSLVGVQRVYRMHLPPRPAHRVLLVSWFVLYAYVGVQMGWMLRPFVGSADLEPRFLREDPFTNGYVVVHGLFFDDR